MMVYLILFIGLVSVALGRWMFGRWFNHVTIYAAIWSFTLALFEIKLIRYYPLEPETWLTILAGGLAFFVGSATVVAVRLAVGAPSDEMHKGVFSGGSSPLKYETRLLRNWLLVMSIIALAGALQLWHVQLQQFGSVARVIILGNIVYSLRVAEGIPGAIPYIDSFALTASFLAGVYTASVGKIKLVAFLPIVVVLLASVAGMGRAKLVIGAILFVSGYFLSYPRFRPHSVRALKIKFKRALAIGLAVVMLVIGIEIVRSSRGTLESFGGATGVLRTLSMTSFVTPSLYLYLTAHYGVLNQYLLQERENVPMGSYTFAPLWRLLSRIGYDTDVPEYQPFYRTPVPSNTGTYLRGIHADFGVLGILLFPYVLGLVSTLLWYRVKLHKRYVDLALLVHLYVVVALSFGVGATRLGYWLVSLLGAISIGFILDHQLRHRARSSENTDIST